MGHMLCPGFILDIGYVYLCGVRVFFQEVSGLRTFEQLLVILLCFTVYPSFFVEIVR